MCVEASMKSFIYTLSIVEVGKPNTPQIALAMGLPGSQEEIYEGHFITNY